MFITEGTKQAKYSKKFEDTHNQRYYTQVVNAVNKKDADVKVVLCQVQENIDENWVLAVEKALPAIENIFATFARDWLNLVKKDPSKVTTEYLKNLSRNNDLLERARQGGPVQNYSDENHPYFTYENKFAYTLVVNLQYFLSRRAQGIKNIQQTAVDHVRQGAVPNADGKKQYTLSAVSFEDGKEGFHSKMEKRIERLNAKMTAFKNHSFMHAFIGMMVRPPIVKTPKILNDPDYKVLYETWQFMALYEKDGYQLNVVENVACPKEDPLSELCSVLALNCCLFNNGDFDRQLENGYQQIVNEESATMALAFSGKGDDKKTVLANFQKRAQEEHKIELALARAIDFETSLQKETETAEEKAKIEIEKQKAKEKAKKEREKQKEKERLAQEKAKEKAKKKALELKAKAEEKARLIKEKAKQKAKEVKAQAKQK
ncbi:MAG: hypothetical protein IJF72_04030 [Clostridia bacterium]|nr:hypothetical protein [Clostridia bacterium]